MELTPDELIAKFFRCYDKPFSAKDFCFVMSDFGKKFTRRECIEMLDEDANLFTLTDGRFITKAGMFSNRCFSFSLTSEEIEKKAFIVGHRTIPFTDPAMLPSELTFTYNGKKLPKIKTQMCGSVVSDLYALFGREFANQYIAADCSNGSKDFCSSDYVLPSKINIAAFSLEPILKNESFTLRDRFLAKVIDWNNGIVAISVQHNAAQTNQMSLDDIKRAEWCELLEKRVIESFDVIGPCASIEDQFSLIFAEYGTELCVPECASIQEMLFHSKKVGFQPYGVETRIWRKNEEVPAIGKWNNMAMLKATPQEIEQAMWHEPVLQTIVDCYIKDIIFNNSDDYASLAPKIYPFFNHLSEYQKNNVLLQLKNQYDIIKSSYNRFTDYELADMRNRVLNLYTDVNKLSYTIDISSVDFRLYPQQPLVIFTQIWGHLKHILNMSELEPNSVLPDVNEIINSLEGMEYNFYEIREMFNHIIKKQKKQKKHGSSVV